MLPAVRCTQKRILRSVIAMIGLSGDAFQIPKTQSPVAPPYPAIRTFLATAAAVHCPLLRRTRNKGPNCKKLAPSCDFSCNWVSTGNRIPLYLRPSVNTQFVDSEATQLSEYGQRFDYLVMDKMEIAERNGVRRQDVDNVAKGPKEDTSVEEKLVQL
jgi:hypothetical protein